MVRAKKAVQRKLSSTQWLTLCVLSRMLQVVVVGPGAELDQPFEKLGLGPVQERGRAGGVVVR